MRGWRRNLAFCLQRLPDEGMLPPFPPPTFLLLASLAWVLKEQAKSLPLQSKAGGSNRLHSTATGLHSLCLWRMVR
ncbi:hypothetical protein STEG23_010658, partial [Scotinomys teguina]